MIAPGIPLLCAYHVDLGTQRRINSLNDLPDSARKPTDDSADPAFTWINLDHVTTSPQLLTETLALDDITTEALLASDTQPRVAIRPDGFLIILRGVNLNPGADPEDMVSIRIWLQPHRIITVRRRPLMAIRALVERYDACTGPRTAPDFLVAVTAGLVERIEPVISHLTDSIDALEESIADGLSEHERTTLTEVRREAIIFRRYIAPQRDALSTLARADVPWFTKDNRAELGDLAADVARLAADLDAIRERAAVVDDELARRLADRTNRAAYLLAVVGAVFLPLSLLTGLLGINVAGIPQDEHPLAFAFVCLILLVIAIAELAILRFLRWL